MNPLAISKEEDLLFGTAPRPVTCGSGVEIGAGKVIPEINFTLPPMIIEDNTWGEVKTQYREMLNGVCRRAVELHTPELVVEFEHLPPMTMKPDWGAELTAIMKEILSEYKAKEGLSSALRVTPVDIREGSRPARMRSGESLDHLMHSFELCSKAGADLLSIESIGGKDLHDQALIQADLAGIIFSLAVLGVRDMRFLWSGIVEIADRNGIIAAGDTACAFANTAMVLAEKGMLPRLLAALVRVGSIVRSLEAYNQGALGPSKDCAYEGPFIKALTGVPISMEGRTSACAHLSSVGNIASVACDLWSNESIQNVYLLSGDAPVVSMEQLVYDCRLMNAAAEQGNDAIRRMQSWCVDSDACYDSQAWVLRPDVVITIVKEIANLDNPIEATIKGMQVTLELLQEAVKLERLQVPAAELRWYELFANQLLTIPIDAEALLGDVQSRFESDLFIWEEFAGG